MVPALNEGENLRRTVEGLRATLPAGAEIVVVDDGSTDGSTDFLSGANGRVRVLHTARVGCARARNRGAAAATGDVLVFADAHVEAPPGWWEPLVGAIAPPRIGAAGPAISVMGQPESKGFGLRVTGPALGVEWLAQRGFSPYSVPILCGAFLAVRRDVFEATGGFDEGLIRWGGNDLELSLRLWLLGYELRLVPGVEVAHLFRQKHPYTVDWTGVLHNLLRIAFLHFRSGRIQRVVEALQGRRGFASALALAVDSDAWTRRSQLAASRARDDNWFFDSFGITC